MADKLLALRRAGREFHRTSAALVARATGAGRGRRPGPGRRGRGRALEFGLVGRAGEPGDGWPDRGIAGGDRGMGLGAWLRRALARVAPPAGGGTPPASMNTSLLRCTSPVTRHRPKCTQNLNKRVLA